MSEKSRLPILTGQSYLELRQMGETGVFSPMWNSVRRGTSAPNRNEETKGTVFLSPGGTIRARVRIGS